MEIWKQSPIGPLFIEASNFGRLRTLERLTHGISKYGPITQLRPAKILNGCVGNNGYVYQAIQDGKTRKKYLVHRLVASCFCDGFDPNLTVNHINGKKLDNQATNLEWITKPENTKHQWKIGLVNLIGENHPSHKLKNADVLLVRSMIIEGYSISKIAEHFNVSAALIYKIKSGKKRLTL